MTDTVIVMIIRHNRIIVNLHSTDYFLRNNKQLELARKVKCERKQRTSVDWLTVSM